MRKRGIVSRFISMCLLVVLIISDMNVKQVGAFEVDQIEIDQASVESEQIESDVPDGEVVLNVSLINSGNDNIKFYNAGSDDLISSVDFIFKYNNGRLEKKPESKHIEVAVSEGYVPKYTVNDKNATIKVVKYDSATKRTEYTISALNIKADTSSIITFSEEEYHEYGLNIVADENIESLNVIQNGAQVEAEEGVYTVNNSAVANIVMTPRDGYVPYIYDETDSDNVVTYTNFDCSVDIDSNTYTFQVSPKLAKTFRIESKPAHTVTFHNPEGVELLSGIRCCNYSSDATDENGEKLIEAKYEISAFEEGIANVVLPDGNWYFSVDFANLNWYQKGILAFDEELSNRVESFEYMSGYLYEVNVDNDIDIYTGCEYATRSVEYPEGVEIQYLNASDEEDNVYYEVSDDGKLLKLHEVEDIRFRFTGADGANYKVYAISKSDEGDQSEQLFPYDDEDGIPYYFARVSDFYKLEIIKVEEVSVRFNTVHAKAWFIEENDLEGYKTGLFEKGTKLKFCVESSDDSLYTIESVKINDEDATLITDGTPYEYEFTVKEDTVINVVAVPLPQDLYVYKHMDCGITFTSENIWPDDPEDGNTYYHIGYSVGIINFDVEVLQEDVPDVYFKNADGRLMPLTHVKKSDVRDGKIVYSYSMYSDELTDDDNALIITNKGTSDDKVLTLKYDDNGLGNIKLVDKMGDVLHASKSETAVEEESLKHIDTYDVKYGERYSLLIEADDNYYIYRVGSTIDGALGNIVDGSVDIDVYADLDITVKFKKEKSSVLCEEPVVGEESQEVPSLISTRARVEYSLIKDKSYIYRIKNGDGEYVKIKKYSLGSEEWSATKKEDFIDRIRFSTKPEASYDSPIPTISFSENGKRQAGYIELADGTRVNVYVTVHKPLTAIKVIAKGDSRNNSVSIIPADGANNKDSISVAVDRRVSFSVSVYKEGKYKEDNNNSTLDSLKVKYVPDAGGATSDIAYEWKGNYVGRASATLNVVAGDEAGKTGKLIFYTDDVDNPLATVKVTTTSTPATTVEPKAIVVKSDDISVTLGFMDNAKIPTCINGNQYYRVTVTPKTAGVADTIVPKAVYVPISRPEYPEHPGYPENASPSQEESIDNKFYAQIEKIDREFVQNEKIIVNNVAAGTGYGCACDFGIKVEFVQTKSRITSANIESGSTAYYIGKVAQQLTAATKDPSFETKVGVKKGTTTMYSGQKEVLIGTGTFNSKTSCQAVSAKDITECDEKYKLSISIVDDTKIYASASNVTMLGKHTIEVLPVGPTTMYAQPVTFVVTVNKGISKLSVSPNSSSVYKKNNTAASIDLNIIYNEGDEAPKIKKVTYDVLTEDKESISELSSSESKLVGKVQVKGNKVSIDKSLELAEDSISFYVKATAADYVGNETVGMSPLITINGEQTVISKIGIFSYDRATKKYKQLANSDSVSNLLASELDGTLIFATKADELRDEYYSYELPDDLIPSSDYVLKASNKAINVVQSGNVYALECSGVAKNIKLTATVSDGGKNKKELTVTSTYYEPENMGVVISDETGKKLTSGDGDLTANFAGNSNTKVMLKVKSIDRGVFNDLKSIANYTLSVSGGKIIDKNADTGDYTIVVNKDKAIVTLTNKNKALNSKDANYKKIYTINNTTYVSKAGLSVKPVGTLKSDGRISQDMTLTIKANKDYSLDGKYLLIELDGSSALAKKTAAAYETFNSACVTGLNNPIAIANDITNGYNVKLSFNDSTLKVGKYKIVVTPGTYSGGVFTPDAKSVNATISVAKPKVNKGTLKFATSYKFAKDKETGKYPSSLNIAYTKKDVRSLTIDPAEVKNANVKGQENKFNNYFEIVLTDDGAKVKLKDGLTQDQINYITSKDGANDRIGYITYQVEMGDDGYGNPFINKTDAVKITVDFK